jgi:hypothetical protein
MVNYSNAGLRVLRGVIACTYCIVQKIYIYILSKKKLVYMCKYVQPTKAVTDDNKQARTHAREGTPILREK